MLDVAFLLGDKIGWFFCTTDDRFLSAILLAD